MKYLLLLLFVSLIKCENSDYYDCLEEVAKPRAEEVISNIRNHLINQNLPIIFNILIEQVNCVYTVSASSLNNVRDTIYKDIYQYIFKNDKNLLLIHQYYWNMKDDEKTIKKCVSVFGDKFECKELIDSFNDWVNKKIE